ncbi:hypothetical protein F4778DRAFT_78 [Xylariomycetidae sp. FL2044]|nr:hypothetical protein F4778DRAFT_78 [Xylariomycetidae sp. FL2044]
MSCLPCRQAAQAMMSTLDRIAIALMIRKNPSSTNPSTHPAEYGFWDVEHVICHPGETSPSSSDEYRCRRASSSQSPPRLPGGGPSIALRDTHRRPRCSDTSSSGTSSTDTIDSSDTPAQSELSKRSRKVLLALFPKGGTRTPQIRWSDFKQTMEKLGFVSEKSSGSKTTFTPGDSTPMAIDSPGEARAVAFHRPHPGSRLRPDVAREFGKKLRDNYGWTGEMFGI